MHVRRHHGVDDVGGFGGVEVRVECPPGLLRQMPSAIVRFGCELTGLTQDQAGVSRVWAVPELQPLHAGHAPAVLAFELANRGYFAAFISDRGDDFFEQFTERYQALLLEQEASRCAYYVLVGEDGSVIGRFNLYDIKDGTAVLGYRVAEHVAGRGVATAAVRELCLLAAAQHGLRTLKAATTRDNVASQKVLAKARFVPVGPADIVGKQGTWYERDLTPADPDQGRPRRAR